MFARYRCLLGRYCLGLMGAVGCAVFPDQATLPARPDAPGAAGAMSADAGAGGQGEPSQPHDGGAGGVPGAAGPHEGGAGGAAGQAGTGGEGTPVGGSGGVADCADPRQQVVEVSADSWIDAANTSAKHGTEELLSVAGGASEKRALMALTLPVVPSGAVLRKASFELQLLTNADAGLGERRLSVRQLARDLDEARVTWNNYGTGASRKWNTPGGDFAGELSNTLVPATTAEGQLSFDLTDAIRGRQGAVASPLSLLVLESGTAPAAPAELAFASSESKTAQRPRLVLDYCGP